MIVGANACELKNTIVDLAATTNYRESKRVGINKSHCQTRKTKYNYGGIKFDWTNISICPKGKVYDQCVCLASTHICYGISCNYQ